MGSLLNSSPFGLAFRSAVANSASEIPGDNDHAALGVIDPGCGGGATLLTKRACVHAPLIVEDLITGLYVPSFE